MDTSEIFKIVVFGDSKVGKTSLIRRFADDIFDTDTKSTIGIDFKIRTVQIENSVAKLYIWDTVGSERYLHYMCYSSVFWRKMLETCFCINSLATQTRK